MSDLKADYRHQKTLPSALLSKYLSHSSLKDRDEDNYIDGIRYRYLKDVYVWGSGDFTLLFATSFVDKAPREMTELDKTLKDQSLGTLAIGKGHYIGCSVGDAICWGLNESGQLGLGDRQNKQSPVFVTKLFGSSVYIASVACGEGHTLALTREGQLYSWGQSRSGQLGRQVTTKQRSDLPFQIDALLDKTIIFVAANQDNSAAITNTGELYTWGSNIYGQIGSGTTEPGVVSRPRLVDTLVEKFVRQVAVGFKHYIVLAHDRDSSRETTVYVCGSGEKGVLGTGVEVNSAAFIEIAKPRMAPGEQIVSVKAGAAHNAALTDIGNVFCWGDNEYGQIAGGEGKTFAAVPTLVEATEGIRSIACGAYHTLALHESGLYVWGKGGQGQLGIGELRTCKTPAVLDGFRVSNVALLTAGYDHSLIINFPKTFEYRRIVNQIIESEQLFLRNITITIDIYVAALRRKQTPAAPGGSGTLVHTDPITILFNSVDSLQQQTRHLIHSLLLHLQEVDTMGTKVAVGNIYMQSNVVPVTQMYLQFYTNALAVDALQRSKTETDVAMFKECADRLTRERKGRILGEIELLLRAPLDHIGEYVKLFTRLIQALPQEHSDYFHATAFFTQIKELKRQIKGAINDAERTSEFWKKNRSLKPIISPDKRFLNDLTSNCVLLREFALDKYTYLLFNTTFVMVTYLDYYNSLPPGSGTHIHFVIDLPAAWLFATSSELDLVVQTPENRYTIVTKDRHCRAFCFELLRGAIYTLLLKYNFQNETLVTPSDISRRHILRYKFSSSSPIFPDAVYKGEWKDAKMHGKGVITFNNGNIYDGLWLEGVQEGEGAFDDKVNKTIYTGQWKHGKFNGQGVMRYRDKHEQYQGEWKDNKRHGFGTLTGANYKHVGCWRDDKPSGFGVHIYENGDVFMGVWENGLRDKVGWLIHKNGDTYEGEWKQDKPYGRGAFVYNTHTKGQDTHFKGWFSTADGQYPGELVMPGGVAFSGNFGFVNDPQKLGFNGYILFDSTKRNKPQVHDGEMKSKPNPGHEVTDGKEWVRYFLDKNFDEDKWQREKESTTVEDLRTILSEHSTHSLASFFNEFLQVIQAAITGVHLASFDAIRDRFSPHLVAVARPLLAKIVADIQHFRGHLEHALLEYFGLVNNPPGSLEYATCVDELNLALFERLHPHIWPLYLRINHKDDTGYAKTLKLLGHMSDLQLFDALGVDKRFRLIKKPKKETPEAEASPPPEASLPEVSGPLPASPPSARAASTSLSEDILAAASAAVSTQSEPVSPELPDSVRRPPPPIDLALSERRQEPPAGPGGEEEPVKRTGGSGKFKSHTLHGHNVHNSTPNLLTASPATPLTLQRHLLSHTTSSDLVKTPPTPSAATGASVQPSALASGFEDSGELSEPSFANGAVNLTDDFLLNQEAIEEAKLNQETSSYQHAIEKLQALPSKHSPFHKIKLLRETFALIHKSVARFWKNKPKKRITCLDEMLPVFMFVVIRAKLPQLQSDCHMLSDFLSEQHVIGEAGMMSQTLAASFQHITTFDWLQFFDVTYTVNAAALSAK